MRDMSLPIKGAIVMHLAADPAITALVPADQIYPMKATNVEWPFIQYGVPVVRPYNSSCGEGSDVDVTIHCYAAEEDDAYRIVAAIENSLDSFAPSFNLQSLDWLRTQVIPEGDGADKWHGIAQFNVIAIQ